MAHLVDQLISTHIPFAMLEEDRNRENLLTEQGNKIFLLAKDLLEDKLKTIFEEYSIIPPTNPFWGETIIDITDNITADLMDEFQPNDGTSSEVEMEEAFQKKRAEKALKTCFELYRDEIKGFIEHEIDIQIDHCLQKVDALTDLHLNLERVRRNIKYRSNNFLPAGNNAGVSSYMHTLVALNEKNFTRHKALLDTANDMVNPIIWIHERLKGIIFEVLWENKEKEAVYKEFLCTVENIIQRKKEAAPNKSHISRHEFLLEVVDSYCKLVDQNNINHQVDVLMHKVEQLQQIEVHI